MRVARLERQVRHICSSDQLCGFRVRRLATVLIDPPGAPHRAHRGSPFSTSNGRRLPHRLAARPSAGSPDDRPPDRAAATPDRTTDRPTDRPGSFLKTSKGNAPSFTHHPRQGIRPPPSGEDEAGGGPAGDGAPPSPPLEPRAGPRHAGRGGRPRGGRRRRRHRAAAVVSAHGDEEPPMVGRAPSLLARAFACHMRALHRLARSRVRAFPLRMSERTSTRSPKTRPPCAPTSARATTVAPSRRHRGGLTPIE